MKEEDLCPVTKKFCPLHDIGSNKRHWCDNQGDPEEGDPTQFPDISTIYDMINSWKGPFAMYLM